MRNYGSDPNVSPQSLMLQIASERLEKETASIAAAKEAYLNENCPPLSLPHGVEELQVWATFGVCGLFHNQI